MRLVDLREIIDLACAASGLQVSSVLPLQGGYGGGNFRAESSVGQLVLKLRSEARPLVFARSASHLMQRHELVHSAVVAGPLITPAGWLLCSKWLSGQPIAEAGLEGWSDEQASEFGRDFGRWLRRLHSIRAPGLQWLPRAETRFGAKLRTCLDQHLVDHRLADHLQEVWVESRPALKAAPLSLIHRDLQPGNVIVRDAVFVGVIDLEQARLADPLYDLVKPIDQVLKLHPAVGPAFFDAYELDFADKATIHRLQIAHLLEYLSALVYFGKRSDRVGVADNRRRLLTLLDQGVKMGA